MNNQFLFKTSKNKNYILLQAQCVLCMGYMEQ